MSFVLLLGPPGAGKGTVADALITEGFTHLSTGDILRKAIAAETEVGLIAKEFMDKGQLVPDQVVLEIVKARLMEASADERFLFDGFPRTLVQAEKLDEIFAECDAGLDSVVQLDCADDVIVNRLTGRRVCSRCGATFHLVYKKPAEAGVCDVDGGQLFQRDDDSEATVRHRLEIYAEQTEPLVSFYRKQGLLKKVDASAGINEVSASVLQALN